MALGDLISGGFSLIGSAINAANAAKKNKQAGEYDKQALSKLKELETYEMDDLYKRLQFGSGTDDLQRFNIGKALQVSMLSPSDFNRLASDNRIANTTTENFSALKAYRDEGMREVDRNQQEQILKRQREQTKALQSTIIQNAVERGLDPTKTNLNARLAAVQNAAETGSLQSMQLASDTASRRMKALDMLNDAVAADYARKAQIASARDRFSMANKQAHNSAAEKNWIRSNSIGDENTRMHNELVESNTTGYLNARQGVIDSTNRKRELLSDYYGNQSSALRGQAGVYSANANAGFRHAASGLGNAANDFYSNYKNNRASAQAAPRQTRMPSYSETSE